MYMIEENEIEALKRRRAQRLAIALAIGGGICAALAVLIWGSRRLMIQLGLTAISFWAAAALVWHRNDEKHAPEDWLFWM